MSSFSHVDCLCLLLQGLITYVQKTSGPPVAGIIASLISLLVFREVQPYENPTTNALATFGQWQLLSTYLVAYALLIELKSAPEHKLVWIGTLLLLSNLATVFVALWLQVCEGDRQVELDLTLAEHEMREAELKHEQEQMRADIEELLKRSGLELEVAASAVELSTPIGKAAAIQMQMFMEAVKETTDFPSFTSRSYPCWVISLTSLAAYDELPAHEDAIDKLEELLPDSTSPSCAYSFFISQNWEGGRPGTQSKRHPQARNNRLSVRDYPHPDNGLNTKVSI